jgi:hypothetical protein
LLLEEFLIHIDNDDKRVSRALSSQFDADSIDRKNIVADDEKTSVALEVYLFAEDRHEPVPNFFFCFKPASPVFRAADRNFPISVM